MTTPEILVLCLAQLLIRPVALVPVSSVEDSDSRFGPNEDEECAFFCGPSSYVGWGMSAGALTLAVALFYMFAQASAEDTGDENETPRSGAATPLKDLGEKVVDGTGLLGSKTGDSTGLLGKSLEPAGSIVGGGTGLAGKSLDPTESTAGESTGVSGRTGLLGGKAESKPHPARKAEDGKSSRPRIKPEDSEGPQGRGAKDSSGPPAVRSKEESARAFLQAITEGKSCSDPPVEGGFPQPTTDFEDLFSGAFNFDWLHR